MNPDELKAHRRAICEALIEGKQCQVPYSGSWIYQPAETIACNLFRPGGGSMEIRIKPEQRKCWVGWRGIEYAPIFAEDDEAFRYLKEKYPAYNWQLVTEEVK